MGAMLDYLAFYLIVAGFGLFVSTTAAGIRGLRLVLSRMVIEPYVQAARLGSIYGLLTSVTSIVMHVSLGVTLLAHLYVIYARLMIAGGVSDPGMVAMYVAMRGVIQAAGLVAAVSSAVLLSLRGYLLAIRGFKPRWYLVAVEVLVVLAYLVSKTTYIHLGVAAALLAILVVASVHYGRASKVYASSLLAKQTH
ncbi:hypothetical protein [Pyrolobus fumarii]|uniref:hypothetical protein n=1 Tax=Pyrolobus fumarii TaxID=54252 RepID=UPI00064F912A|nr:hypothetical protein [Pyrolobus fumarii]